MRRNSVRPIVGIILIAFAQWAKADYDYVIKMDETALPSELILLTRTLELTPLDKDENMAFANSLKSLNIHLAQMDPSQALFMTKALIYSSIIKIKWREFEQSARIEKRDRQSLTDAYAEKRDWLFPLTRWVFDALFVDLTSIMDEKDYLAIFTAYKNRPELRKAKKKHDLIRPWMHAIRSLPPERIEATLAPAYLSVLKTLSSLAQVYVENAPKRAPSMTLLFSYDEPSLLFRQLSASDKQELKKEIQEDSVMTPTPIPSISETHEVQNEASREAQKAVEKIQIAPSEMPPPPPPKAPPGPTPWVPK